MKRLLVLGAGGFLGAHVARAAARAGWEVIAAARRAGAAGLAGVRSRSWDGLAPGATAALFTEVVPAAVVNVAALARLGACERDPALARATNVDLAAGVAAAARATGARLVSVSTDLVFGAAPPAGERYVEADPPAPLSVYGRTKAAGEAAVLEVLPAALVCRLPLLYGDSFGRGLGASDALLAELARGARPFLFADEWRTPLDVALAARALVELAGGEARGPLHVAGPERISRAELGLAILRGTGLSLAEARARIDVGRRADRDPAGLRPEDVSLDASLARSRLATPLPGPAEVLGIGGSP